MDLIEITSGAYYLPGATNLGVVATADGRAILIDTGQDEDAARRLLRACKAAGLMPCAIINTHAHADHFGGNEYVTRRTVPSYTPHLLRRPSSPTVTLNRSTSSAERDLLPPYRPSGCWPDLPKWGTSLRTTSWRWEV
jgi:glyoxylase-like metal-dependent hydrolase (beta-lactamase superfamily II)